MLPDAACYLVAPLGPFGTLSRSLAVLREALLHIKGGWGAHGRVSTQANSGRRTRAQASPANGL